MEKEKILKDLIRGTKYEKEVLRNKRKPLLEAFDKYKTNVQYGIETEDAYTHEAILSWYHAILNLDNTNTADNALNNVPARIRYYL